MILKVDEHIELREIELADAEDIFNTIDNQRTYLGEWLPFVSKTKEIADTEAFIKSVVNGARENMAYTFTIRKEGMFVGLIGLKSMDKLNKKTEIGYWLSESYQKQGIVTKSVKCLCDFVFHDIGLNRISIKCAVHNEPSKNIPKRLGFTFEGIERDGELVAENVYRDLEIYSKLK